MIFLPKVHLSPRNNLLNFDDDPEKKARTIILKGEPCLALSLHLLIKERVNKEGERRTSGTFDPDHV